MNAQATSPEVDDYFPRRRRRRLPQWVGPAALILIVSGIATLLFLQRPTTGERQRETKIINVVLPPPPPPPPAPERPKPPEPVKQVLEQPIPQPTPPPPTPAATPQANDTLTARAGPAAGAFGLQQGNGSGERIGGRPGGDAFGAYAAIALADIRRAAENDPKLSGQRYTIAMAVQIDSDGRISSARILDSSGDARRDQTLQKRLIGLQLSQRPPEGLPTMRIKFNAANGA